MILDSGSRSAFETGAVRDIQKGKGRCDLLPLHVVSYLCGNDLVLSNIASFAENGDTDNLYAALRVFATTAYDGKETMILEASKHFEEGAEKYGENNWQLGIPVGCYINSAVRHYLKFKRGDNDEPHDRAFVFNVMCCIWESDFHVYRQED